MSISLVYKHRNVHVTETMPISTLTPNIYIYELINLTKLSQFSYTIVIDNDYSLCRIHWL